ncbi:protein PHLOEM PROTEIN 2-LIKE A1-like [Curcuma longa]|uniref:protein PHLOEM PROTEIN 2-LIKE A1-like n=1 Tax=Curcuma longa TaxID=136217 RepID=UPI003D9DE9E1
MRNAESSDHWNGLMHETWVKRVSDDTIYISAKALQISWGNDDRFWKWISLSNDKLPKDFAKHNLSFDRAAELNQVQALQVTGTLDLTRHDLQLNPSKTYEIIYHIKFKVDAFGWSKAPVTFLCGASKMQKMGYAMVALQRSRGVGEWLEIQGGEFKPGNFAAGKVDFRMLEESEWWKGGMAIAGITVRPKGTK